MTSLLEQAASEEALAALAFVARSSGTESWLLATPCSLSSQDTKLNHLLMRIEKLSEKAKLQARQSLSTIAALPASESV